ncbi:MAG: Si-specific NAD(P)(+) transhydrogenase [Planctomycetota bacterium]
MADVEVDLLVIGSGPGGEGAAMAACKLGLSVALVERDPLVGGSCTHRATIPSKALRQLVSQYLELQNCPMVGGDLRLRRLTFPEMLEHAGGVIRAQAELRRGYYLRNDIHLLRGTARFRESHLVEVVPESGVTKTVAARNVVLAVGSRPYRPDDIDFAHPRIHDADSILGLADHPRSLIIYGAGVIGCEYASIFRAMGAKVNLVNSHDRLLSYLDHDIVDALGYHFRDEGIRLRHNETYAAVEARDDGVVLHLRSGKAIKADYLFWAQGRTGNTAGLGLEVLGVEPNRRGGLETDAEFRLPGAEHIRAVGDVVGAPSLASAAYDQGRYVAAHIATGHAEVRLGADVPTGIYTIPEISCLGRNERQLTEARIPYEVGHAFFRNLARAQITGVTVGMLKLLFHRESQEILGIHCFGHQASEIIHIGQAVMAQNAPANNLRYFVNTTFNYPTMAEAYRVAALNGLNRLF